MFKRSPSRNQRSKGFKLKHGLQIFLLLAICVWLLYQVKHSHDKKIAFDKSSMELSEKLENEHEVIKLGRKDLHPRPEEKNSESEIQHKEEEIEGDEEENKPDEDEDEEDEKNKHEAEEDESKPEENDEEGKESGDGELDEQDREKAEEEAEREGDFVDDEEKGKKEETDDGENEEKERQLESVGSSDDQDHDRNTQEAREENYKRDDASSAVVRSTQDLNNEAEDQNSGESIEKELARKNELELDDKTNNTKEINSDQNNSEEKAVAVEEIEGNQNINVIATEEKEDDGSQTNSMVAEDVVLPKASNILKPQSVHTLSSVAQNRTYMSSHSTRDLPNEMVTLNSNEGESKMQMAVHNQAENAGITAKTENSNSDIGLSTTNENADVAHGEFSDASNNAETVVQEGQTEKSSLTTGEESSLSSTSNEIKYGAQSEKAETANGTVEGDNTEASSSTTENAHVIQSVTNNSTQPHEEVARSNLGNLTETESKGMDNEDAALNDN